MADKPQYAFLGIPNALTPEQCDRLVEHVQAHLPKTKAGVYDYKKEKPNGVNEKHRKGHVWQGFTKGNSMLSQGIPHQAITHAYCAWADKFKSYCSPPQVTPGLYEVQLAVYDEPGDHFKHHADQTMGPVELFDKRPLRKMSMSIVLSNPNEYEGGGLRFFNAVGGSVRVSQNKGDIYIFPSWQVHQVDPLISGKRNALVLWFMGDVWV
jgi:predicted 2-oxoglutarate/Fe(II)-dependent dioxygenase YbiX